MKIKITHTSTKPTIILNFILDESGSMAHQRDSVISGFNEYIETMKAQTEAKYFVNLIKFGDKTEFVFKNRPLSEVRKINRDDYNPRFSTALRDAIGNTINLTEGQISQFHPTASTLFYIFTDGEENASTEFVPQKKHGEIIDPLKNMIKARQEKGGWTFSFIGASEDCLNQAQHWGIAPGNTVVYNANNFRAAINALTNSTVCYSSNIANGNYVNAATCSLFKDAGYDTSKKLDEQDAQKTVAKWQVELTQTTE